VSLRASQTKPSAGSPTAEGIPPPCLIASSTNSFGLGPTATRGAATTDASGHVNAACCHCCLAYEEDFEANLSAPVVARSHDVDGADGVGLSRGKRDGLAYPGMATFRNP